MPSFLCLFFSFFFLSSFLPSIHPFLPSVLPSPPSFLPTPFLPRSFRPFLVYVSSSFLPILLAPPSFFASPAAAAAAAAAAATALLLLLLPHVSAIFLSAHVLFSFGGRTPHGFLTHFVKISCAGTVCAPGFGVTLRADSKASSMKSKE
jgi:hypothetical protein